MEEDHPHLRRVTITLDSMEGEEDNNQHQPNHLLSMYLGLSDD